MPDVPEVVAYQSRVALRDQRVSSLTAELENQSSNLSGEASRYSQSVAASNFRRGTPVLATIQKINQIKGRYDVNRGNFESFQNQAQSDIARENQETQVAYDAAVAAQEKENARITAAYNAGTLSQEDFNQLNAQNLQNYTSNQSYRSDLQNSLYYDYLQSHGKELTPEQKLDEALSKHFEEAKLPGQPKPQEVVSTDEKFILGGKPVVAKVGENFITSSGESFKQIGNAGISPSLTEVSTNAPLLSTNDLFALKNAVSVSSVKNIDTTSFVSSKSVTPFQGYVSNQSISSKNFVPTNVQPSSDFLSGLEKSVIEKIEPIAIAAAPYVSPAQSFITPVLTYGVQAATPIVKGVADVTRPFRQTTEFQNALLATKQISEAPFIIGANATRFAIESGLSAAIPIQREFYNIQKSSNKPVLVVQQTPVSAFGQTVSLPGLKFIPANQAPEYTPYSATDEFASAKNRTAILGGSVVALAPYVVGGGISTIQHVADIGSAFRESPTKAATLVGVGIASTVLLNRLGSVGKIIKAQLGGTPSGTPIGSASAYFEKATDIAGKTFGIALFLPYALQTIPNLASNFQAGNVEGFRQNITELQRTSGPLYLGSNIGQKISTGFSITNPFNTFDRKIYGGIEAGPQSVARERLIANVFNAEPGTYVSQTVDIDTSGRANLLERLSGKKTDTFDFSESNVLERLTNKTSKEFDVYDIRKLYESRGATPQNFSEAYQTGFSKLPTSLDKGTVTEFDSKNVESISNDVTSQKIVNEYFKAHTKEFGIFGSGVIEPQVKGVDVAPSGDIDILTSNNNFTKALFEKLNEASPGGFSYSEKPDEFVITKILEGGQTAKLISAHPIEGNQIFPTLERLANTFGQPLFTQTPSGINIENIDLQLRANIQGGFVDIRKGGADIPKVLTITQGVEEYLPENQFGLNLLGKVETFTGFIPPGTKVGDILHFTEFSTPIKDISAVTGVEPGNLVQEFKKINVIGGNTKESTFSTFANNKGEAEGLIEISPLQTPTKTESLFVHELTHSGQNIAGDFLTKIESPYSYYEQPQEIPAYAIQQKFLESRGETLPATILSNTGIQPRYIDEYLKGKTNNPFQISSNFLGGQSSISPGQSTESLAEQFGFGNQSTFGFTPHGAHIVKTGYFPESSTTKLGDILHIGPESQPIKDISTITGTAPNILSSQLKELLIQKGDFSNSEQFAGFGFDKDILTQPQFKNLNPPGALGIAVKTGPEPEFAFPFEQATTGNKIFTEGAIAHELEHAGEFISGVSRVNTSGVTGEEYLQLPTEQRAFAVQERFLESKGQTLDFGTIMGSGIGRGSDFIQPVSKPTNISEVVLPTNNTSNIESFLLNQGKKSVARPIFESTDYDPNPVKINFEQPYEAPPYQKAPLILLDIYRPTKQGGYQTIGPSYSTPYIPKQDVYAPTSYPVTSSYIPQEPYVPEEPYLPPEVYPPKIPGGYGVAPPGGYSPYIPTTVNPYTPVTINPYSPITPAPYQPIVPRTPRSLIPYIPTLPNKPKKTFFENKKQYPTKKTGFGEGYDVFALKRIPTGDGKQQFVEIDYKGSSLSKEDALKFGQNVIDQALEASFFIKPSKSPIVPLEGLSDLSYKFRLSKQKIRKTIPVYVELETYRLDTPSEVRKIHAAKIAAGLRKKNILRPSKKKVSLKRKNAFEVI